MDRLAAVPVDYLQFGSGRQFKAKEVADYLRLTKMEVARLASVEEDEVRYDDDAPAAVRKCLEEIAATINLVARQFDGDVERTVVWFKARNPMLGDVSPQDMIRRGRHSRLRLFIGRAMDNEQEASASQSG